MAARPTVGATVHSGAEVWTAAPVGAAWGKVFFRVAAPSTGRRGDSGWGRGRRGFSVQYRCRGGGGGAGLRDKTVPVDIVTPFSVPVGFAAPLVAAIVVAVGAFALAQDGPVAAAFIMVTIAVTIAVSVSFMFTFPVPISVSSRPNPLPIPIPVSFSIPISLLFTMRGPNLP